MSATTRSNALRALGAAALLALCHCDAPPSPFDASADAAMDASAEAAMDAASSDAVEPHPACDTIIDLTMAEPLDAGSAAVGVRWTGDNLDTPEGIGAALQPSAGRCEFRAIKQRLFRYRLRADAALRVSTNNPGSDTSFDSSIFVTSAPCSRAATVLACNDDDPFAPPNPHVTLSQATTGGLAAGTEVIISVSGFYPAAGGAQGPNPAGETGTFELTVIEVPSREIGAQCDTSGRSDACVNGAHCIADDAGRGACVRDGSRPGAQCDNGGSCESPLECDVRRFTCFGTSAMSGAACELGESANRCGAGLTCVTALRGQRRGVCAPNGSAGAACIASEAGVSDCAGGLVCARGVCKRPVTMGASCNLSSDACAAGASCVASAPGGAVGTCVPDGSAHGAACRSGASECDAGLFCIVAVTSADRACRTVGSASGARCDNQGACSFEWPCVIDEPSRPFEGVCRLPGETGTECQADAGCTGGRRCVGRTSTAAGRCLAVLSLGAECDVDRRTDACESGASCVTVAGRGQCVTNGTAAGATCRTGASPCDAALSCATDLGNRCVSRATNGAACDPRYNTVRCETGSACIASSFDAGICAAPSMESEPNDSLSGASAASMIGVRGALSRFDTDCFALTVAAMGSVFAQAVNPNGQCTNNIVLDLYGPDGAWLGSDADSGPASCPRIDGSAHSWARSLATGTHHVCVREANNQLVGAYVLSARAAP